MFNVVLQARGSGPLIWGYKNGSRHSEIVMLNRTHLGPYMDLERDQYIKKSVSVFLLDASHVVSYEEEKVLSALRSLGAKRVHGTIGLYPFSRKDLVGHSPDYIHDYRRLQRKQREQQAKENGRAKRHIEKTEDMDVDF
ncbi:hypothetical protein PFISCL1PPCAC_13206 [Pristionchus fissidentatus]|uniref:Uncharacterized protein n=1 Tax=Pristionchus fissidentatus TaxID=1538716 RepID=A0AAV5VVX4_9BILA|nr:hypothetical protein PFISCL1PPCAC_13206 [Pristionchus fissidentatus]